MNRRRSKDLMHRVSPRSLASNDRAGHAAVLIPSGPEVAGLLVAALWGSASPPDAW